MLPMCTGRGAAASPLISDVDLFGDRQRVVDLDTKVSDRALNLENVTQTVTMHFDGRRAGSPRPAKTSEATTGTRERW
jgi:hypothetical protein